MVVWGDPQKERKISIQERSARFAIERALFFLVSATNEHRPAAAATATTNMKRESFLCINKQGHTYMRGGREAADSIIALVGCFGGSDPYVCLLPPPLEVDSEDPLCMPSRRAQSDQSYFRARRVNTAEG